MEPNELALHTLQNMGVDALDKKGILYILVMLSEGEHFPAALLDFWKDDQLNGAGIATAALLGYLPGMFNTGPQAQVEHDQDWPLYHPDLVIAQPTARLDRAQLVALLAFATQYLGQRAKITPDAVYSGLEAGAMLLEAGQPLENISDPMRASMFTEDDD